MFKRAGLVAALLLANLAIPLPALAVNDTSETASTLTAANAAVSDTLVGNSGGAFRYYRIDYPGGGASIPITMRAQPGRGTGGVATGFKVYGPAGLSGEAVPSDQSTSDSTYAFTLSNLLPGAYYVQVYNFVQGMPMSFQLNAQNLPGPVPAPAPAAAAPSEAPAAPTEGEVAPAEAAPAPPPAAPAPAPAPTGPIDNSVPERAIVASGTTFTTGGTLAGKGGGSFQYFYVDYPGGRTNMTITLGYSPITPDSSKAVSFNLYRPDPANPQGAVVVGYGSETGRNDSSATSGFTYSGDPAERFLLQVANYLPNTTINYTLIVSGLAGPVVQVGDISSPAQAFVLSVAQPAAVGTLPGARDGRFHYFLVQYPGSNREVRVTATTDPAPGLGDGMFGFNLYKGADSAGTAKGNLDDKSRRTATMTINQGDAATIGIQIYNYSDKVDAHYAITVSGL